MKKKLIIFLEIIYNLFLGFWIPTVYQLIKFCIKEINQEDIGNILLIFIVFIIMAILVFPMNIIFIKRINSKKIIIKSSSIIILSVGIIIGVCFQLGGIINV